MADETSAGKIGLDLVVNQDQFQRQMKGITGVAKKAGAALASAFAVGKLVEFGKKCLELGSDLAEVQNVVDVTFPALSAQVDQFAKSAAASFGLSETMAKQYTGTFGAMAKAFGFTEKQALDMGTTLTGLTGDVASFYNLSQDEAYTKIKSVFTGETESLKDLGVVMTQTALDSYALANGFGKTTAKMSEAEKVALRYQFVQDQLSAAQGDFARTSDSWANQCKILSLQMKSLMANVGQGLINLFSPVLKVINAVVGRLSVLASAFKSFTELITGQKSSGTADNMQQTAEGMDNAADSAENLKDNTDAAGDAATKASKKLKSLMGFDKINRLDKKDDSSKKSSTSNTVPDVTGSVDFGKLAEGETVVDGLNSKMQDLLEKGKELASLFKQGFLIGFGDSEKRIDGICKKCESIGKTLKSIFTDVEIQTSASGLFDAIALNAGKITGSFVNIGTTIASNLVGAIDRYLQSSEGYIHDRLVSMLDTSADTVNLVGDFFTSFADVFSIFADENGEACSAELLGMISDAFLGTKDLTLKLTNDVLSCILQPFIDNKDKIKEAIDNTLKPIRTVLETLHASVKETFEKILDMYDEHISPMFDGFKEGFSEILSTLLDGYNKYFAPVLSKLSTLFQNVWTSSIQPTINNIIGLVGDVADLINVLWRNVFKPFINWIASAIFPVISPIIEALGTVFLNFVGGISKNINSVIKILRGIIQFVTGVFSGDWEKAWKSVLKIWNGMTDLFKSPINIVIGFANGLIAGIESAVNSVANMFNSLEIEVPDWVPGIGGHTLGFNLPTWDAPRIPLLAQGGFVKANTPRLAVIGDNRHEGEVVAPESKLQAMVDAAVAAAGGGGVTKEEMESIANNATMRIVAALANVSFNLDGSDIARASARAQIGINKRFNTVDVG